MTYQFFKQWLFVEVPEDAYDFELYINGIGKIFLWAWIDDNYLETELPSGNYTIIGKGDELSEEQLQEKFDKKEIDGKMTFGAHNKEGGGIFYTSAKECFSGKFGLLKSLGFEPSTTLVLLNNEKA